MDFHSVFLGLVSYVVRQLFLLRIRHVAIQPCGHVAGMRNKHISSDYKMVFVRVFRSTAKWGRNRGGVVVVVGGGGGCEGGDYCLRRGNHVTNQIVLGSIFRVHTSISFSDL